MAYDILLSEGYIKGMSLRNRIITGPMERGMADRDGSLTQVYTDYLVERASGGASLIMIESTYVDPRGMGHLYQVGCHDDHVIPGLTRAAEGVHEKGARLGIELYFGGRQTPSYMSQRQPLAPSVVPCATLDPVPVPREMTKGDIKEITKAFAVAARRAVEAGVDMIHLHGAHGYLLGAFLSPYSNRRTDAYGGSAEKRARFPLEVLAAVRESVGCDVPIGYRMSAEEYVEGGLTVEDTAGFAVQLAEAGIDLIDVSGGVYESFEMIIQGPEAPKGGFVRNAVTIKRAVGERVAVSVGQRLNDPEFANDVLARQGLDFVTLSRAFHADPEYVQKVREGRTEDIIPCIACHHCTNLLEANAPVRCAANPSSGLERRRRIRPVVRARRAVVVGGGPAGMQAARILRLQGNDVRLYEQEAELGGQVRYSSRVAPDYGYLVTYLARQMSKLEVDVQVGKRVDAEMVLAEEPDAIVVATGAVGGLRYFATSGQVDTVDLFGALDRPEDSWVNGRIVIAGGDSESCFLALYLAGCGAEVDLVEPKTGFSDDKLSPGRDLLLAALEELPTIRLRPRTTVERAGEGYVVVQSEGREETLSNITSVVIGGRVADRKFYDELYEVRRDLEIYCIGDAVEPRDVYCASHEAADVAEVVGRQAQVV